MSHQLRSFTVCHKMLLLWSSYCKIAARIQTECAADCCSYKKNLTLTQTKQADFRKSHNIDMCACVCVCVHVDTDVHTYGL